MIDTALQKLADQGILGVLLGVTCLVIFKLYSKLEAKQIEKDAAIEKLQAEKEEIMLESLRQNAEHFTTFKDVLTMLQQSRSRR